MTRIAAAIFVMRDSSTSSSPPPSWSDVDMAPTDFLGEKGVVAVRLQESKWDRRGAVNGRGVEEEEGIRVLKERKKDDTVAGCLCRSNDWLGLPDIRV